MSEFKLYRKRSVTLMRPYIPGEDLTDITVGAEDVPCAGGMIAQNPDNPKDQWYISQDYFADNYVSA